jgi:S-adenosyl-L-methionine hydrolase (adenosine-forming)
VARPITFLSDYGYDDEFAGVCRAVIARIAPRAPVIDITHGISRHDVRQGAAVLANVLPYAAAGVHLAVVDPQVGTERRAVAVRVADQDRVLVGPDNGLLWPAIERLGGPAAAADVSLSPFRLEPLSATFHGRDVFAPVAAVLSQGGELHEVGEALDARELTRLDRRPPRIEAGDRIIATVAYVDRYGNAALDLAGNEALDSGLRLGHRLSVEAGGNTHQAVYAVTFADVPADALLLYLDSYRNLALAVNRGNAAERLGLEPGGEVVLRPGADEPRAHRE